MSLIVSLTEFVFGCAVVLVLILLTIKTYCDWIDRQ